MSKRGSQPLLRTDHLLAKTAIEVASLAGKLYREAGEETAPRDANRMYLQSTQIG